MIEAYLHFAAVRVDAGIGVTVAGVLQNLAGDLLGTAANVVEDSGISRPELAGDDNQIIGNQGFAGDLGRCLAGQEGIQDRV